MRFSVGNENRVIDLVNSAHVHLNEPGREDWEGFSTGTKAAASGGVTTVVDMPLNSIPPTTTVENYQAKRVTAQEQCQTDVAFWGGVIPGNQVYILSQNSLLYMILNLVDCRCLLLRIILNRFLMQESRDSSVFS